MFFSSRVLRKTEVPRQVAFWTISIDYIRACACVSKSPKQWEFILEIVPQNTYICPLPSTNLEAD